MGGSLWIESPKGLVPKEYMGGQVMGTRCDLSMGTPLVFSGKRLLHCTEEWSGRRIVAVAFTLMGAFSIEMQLTGAFVLWALTSRTALKLTSM